MYKDPVCGMKVDENNTLHKIEYEGITYYFCLAVCKKVFEEDPSKFKMNKNIKQSIS